MAICARVYVLLGPQLGKRTPGLGSLVLVRISVLYVPPGESQNRGSGVRISSQARINVFWPHRLAVLRPQECQIGVGGGWEAGASVGKNLCAWTDDGGVRTGNMSRGYAGVPVPPPPKRYVYLGGSVARSARCRGVESPQPPAGRHSRAGE